MQLVIRSDQEADPYWLPLHLHEHPLFHLCIPLCLL